MHYLKIFSKDIIKIVGFILTTKKCNHWTAESVKITLVEYGYQAVFELNKRRFLSIRSLSWDQSKLV